MSCKGNKNNYTDKTEHNEMIDNDEMGSSDKMMANNNQDAKAEIIIQDYFELKNALVATNKDNTAKAGKKLESRLNYFNVSSYTSEQQEELRWR
jgi:homoserine dehydrogenase